MKNFIDEDLTGSKFEDVYLTEASFADVDLTNARFRLVDLTGVVIRGAALVDVDLSDERLAGLTDPVLEPGYPEPESFAVLRCLRAIVNEEWEHRLYAERDLDVLEARSAT